MKAYQVEVVISPWTEGDEGGYIAEVPGLQGCWIVAPTVTKAMEQIVEATQMYVDSLLVEGRALPGEVVETKKRSIKAKIAVSIP